MEKSTPPSLFVNDGSFMERFKQLQQDKDKEKERGRGATSVEESKPIKIVAGNSVPKISMNKPTVDTRKSSLATSGGKLAFSLKQKSKLVGPPVKLGADEDEDEADVENSADAPVKRQKLDPPEASEQPSKQVVVGNYCFYMNYSLILFAFRVRYMWNFPVFSSFFWLEIKIRRKRHSINASNLVVFISLLVIYLSLEQDIITDLTVFIFSLL